MTAVKTAGGLDDTIVMKPWRRNTEMNENTKLLLFTGSYASAEESGVQVFEFNGEAGAHWNCWIRCKVSRIPPLLMLMLRDNGYMPLVNRGIVKAARKARLSPSPLIHRQAS